MVPKYQRMAPKIHVPWRPPYWFPMWRQNDSSFAYISCSISPSSTIQVSIPMFSMYMNILAMSEFTSEGHHIGFQDGRHMFIRRKLWYVDRYIGMFNDTEKDRQCSRVLEIEYVCHLNEMENNFLNDNWQGKRHIMSIMENRSLIMWRPYWSPIWRPYDDNFHIVNIFLCIAILYFPSKVEQ